MRYRNIKQLQLKPASVACLKVDHKRGQF